MGLLTRIYFNTVFGALGGLLGWMLFSIFGVRVADQSKPVFLFLTPFDFKLLLDGALIGGGIGYLVVSVEAVRDRSWVRFVRLATYGVVLGAIGGAFGMLLADLVNTMLVRGIGPPSPDEPMLKYGLKKIATVLTRGLGFMFLGAAVGASEGIAARSLGKFSYGTIGGTLGGFLGGTFFGLLYMLMKPDDITQAQSDAAFAGAAGFVVMGACIGALSALVKGVFQPASVKVLRGWQEGREYPLDKKDNTLGRDEHDDIALFRDMKVEKRHALIQRDGARYVLRNNGAPPEQTRVNDMPVAQSVELRDGDRVQLGNILLRFQMKAAQGRQRPGRAVAGRPG